MLLTFIFQISLWNRLLYTGFRLVQVPLKLKWSLKWNLLFVCLWSYRAFDTLAKALNPGESTACQNSESIDTSAQLLGGETSMNIVEIEGPLLSDAHVAFRVLNTFLLLTVYNYFDIVMYNNNLTKLYLEFLRGVFVQVLALISSYWAAFVHWLILYLGESPALCNGLAALVILWFLTLKILGNPYKRIYIDKVFAWSRVSISLHEAESASTFSLVNGCIWYHLQWTLRPLSVFVSFLFV